MLEAKADIAATRAAFSWDIPARYNIGVDICDRLAAEQPEATAILDVTDQGAVAHSFAELRDRSNQLANALSRICAAGDRVGILLPQQVETALGHIAALKLGAITIPLFTQFGPDALAHRLRDAGARVVLTNGQGAATLAAIRGDLPELTHVIDIDGRGFDAFCGADSDVFTPADTAADDPAILIYTSGTTGPPKGALHAHRVLLGHLPGVEMSHDFFPQAGDRIWTPADWAWIGGLLDVLMPALHHGVTVVARRFEKFSGEAAFDLIRTHGIRNAFLPPTALKLMRQAEGEAPVRMRSVASGGETLGAALIDWGKAALGVTINEFYGQTECNMIVSSCAALAPAEPGVMGFAVPGHQVAVIDVAGKRVCDIGEEGAIAVRAPDPVMFLEYWNRPEATAEKFITMNDARWLLTGDQGRLTESGRIAFVGRVDDVISSAGYRIGPAEIEDCLLTHPAVQMAGVIGVPDDVRGSVVAACVTLKAGAVGDDALAEALQAHVAARLAPYERPRIIRFIDTMPLTTTGKIIRADLRRMLEEEQQDG